MDFDKKADGAFKTSIPPILGSHAGVFIACLVFFCLVGGIFSEYLYLYILNNYRRLSHEL